MVRRSSMSRRTTAAVAGILFCCFVIFYLGSSNLSSDCTTQNNKRSTSGDSRQRDVKTFLVVLVVTGPNHVEERDVIRHSWLSQKIPDVIHYFSVGIGQLSSAELSKLEEENSKHGDILYLPTLKDSYNKLTEKLMLSFKWLEQNVDYSFLFKVDGDTFARLETLVTELKETQETDDLYWGFFNGRARVKKRGRWAEPGWVICDNYLPYARGGGYVLSANLVSYIARNSDFLKPFNSEDVSVGAWLGPLKVNRVHDPRFDTEYKSRGCHNKYIVTHKQDKTKIKELFENLKTTGKLCAREIRTMNSYIYNWDVPPSQCCTRNDTSVP